LHELDTKAMKHALYHSDFELYRLRRVNAMKWNGLVHVKYEGINRYMRIQLGIEDIALIEERIGRKLTDKETFTKNPLTITPKYFSKHLWKNITQVSDGRTRVSVAEPMPDRTPITEGVTRHPLHNETVTLQQVMWSPRGTWVKWDATATAPDGLTCKFSIYGEHARLFKQAGYTLTRTGVQKFQIDVVLEWDDTRNGLRVAGVFGANGTLHTATQKPAPVAKPVPCMAIVPYTPPLVYVPPQASTPDYSAILATLAGIEAQLTVAPDILVTLHGEARDEAITRASAAYYIKMAVGYLAQVTHAADDAA
jgi:hypothetical protein